MQFFKNKKYLIACIALVVIVLIVIIAYFTFKKDVTDVKNKYTDGEKTLVDTIGKGNGYSAKVYVTQDQDIEIVIENAKYAKFYAQETKAPIYDEFSSNIVETGEKSFLFSVYTNIDGADYEERPEYPCDCEIVILSEMVGIEYTVNFTVDKEIVYKSGSVVTKEVTLQDIPEYQAHEEKFGKLRLPKGAMPISLEERKENFVPGEDAKAIDVVVCTYALDDSQRELVMMDSSNKETIEGYCTGANVKTFTISDVDVIVACASGRYYAVYTIDKTTYFNKGFLITADENWPADDVIIDALKPFIAD